MFDLILFIDTVAAKITQLTIVYQLTTRDFAARE
jgi:hypothetical protein